jgi:hypothetical protein
VEVGPLVRLDEDAVVTECQALREGVLDDYVLSGGVVTGEVVVGR